jgi:ribosomal protein S18 acetylase RimI-like enzyme
MSNLSIRRYALTTPHPGNDLVPPYTEYFLTPTFAKKRSYAFVVYCDNTPIFVARLHYLTPAYRALRAYDKLTPMPDFELTDVCLHPDFRGKSIPSGRSYAVTCIHKVLEYARYRGTYAVLRKPVANIVLWTNADNEPARRMYEKAGFTRPPAKDTTKCRRWISTVYCPDPPLSPRNIVIYAMSV